MDSGYQAVFQMGLGTRLKVGSLLDLRDQNQIVKSVICSKQLGFEIYIYIATCFWLSQEVL